MTKAKGIHVDLGALRNREESPMKIDIFENAAWRKKMSDGPGDGNVTVRLSSGKKVTVNSKLLGLLRLLVDELAQKENSLH